MILGCFWMFSGRSSVFWPIDVQNCSLSSRCLMSTRPEYTHSSVRTTKWFQRSFHFGTIEILLVLRVHCCCLLQLLGGSTQDCTSSVTSLPFFTIHVVQLILPRSLPPDVASSPTLPLAWLSLPRPKAFHRELVWVLHEMLHYMVTTGEEDDTVWWAAISCWFFCPSAFIPPPPHLIRC